MPQHWHGHIEWVTFGAAIWLQLARSNSRQGPPTCRQEVAMSHASRNLKWSVLSFLVIHMLQKWLLFGRHGYV